jgi:hypothetical protein
MITRKILNIFIILFTLTLYSCVESGSSGKRKSSGSQTTTQEGTVAGPEDDLDIYWYYDGLKIPGTVTINQDIQTVAYLRGSTVHDYLNTSENYKEKYCLAMSYNVGITNNMLKVRAVPISITNFSTNSVERLFRVDLTEDFVNEKQCDGVVPLYNVSGKQDNITAKRPVYKPQDLCTNCFSTFTSSNTSLYKVVNNTINEFSRVTSQTPITRELNLAINPKNLATDPVANCSNSECNSKGFDCCLDGQCVKDAAVKPNISTASASYIQSQAEIAVDPLNFLKWPEVYFICPNIVRPTPPITTPPDPNEEADKIFQALLKQYNCLEGAKTSDYTSCEPTFDVGSFEAIREDVWDECGCEAVGAERLTKCPDFGLKVIKDSGDVITQVLCDNPPTETGPAPTQYLNVPVSVRSIPHRFYDTTGKRWDDLSEIKIPNVIQEGQTFTYTDQVSKSDPTKTQFSMNAVLGSVNLNLTSAVPAKVLRVEFDQSYVISVNSGYYTPCPQCADDAWFTTFKSKPNSYNGTGLQSSGYTTSRDSYGNNLSNGNYEDTIFGRACWLPPTMIPLTHKKNSNLIAQRSNRLLTQAALYINGYQRDWFGFNQGALIGSFNGVNWFAIGKSRRITSTSEKLYLAVNAPFADLADKTDLLINVVTDQGGGTAPDYDYDPNLAINDARQNQGGSCQENHMCNVDSDCVQKLGWEYRCADIGKHKSYWPIHDLVANEKENDEQESLNFAAIISGGRASSDSRRCVYRGNGSLCLTDKNTITESAELFTCAPNFYCASLTSDSFNTELVRSPSEISNILFGQEANVLGRPKDYLEGSESASLEATLKVQADGTLIVDDSTPKSSTIIDQIAHNTSLYNTIDRNQLGLCRPGKDIAQSTQEEMQTAKDNLGRTDFINQISSCDSSNTTYKNRARACPVFNSIGDYGDPNVDLPHLQNMCGAPALSTIGGEEKSIFFEIESDSLRTLTDLIQPKVAKDACLRKPGAYCQTDLDCGPNKLHAQTALLYDKTHFGGTSAEQKYWQEYLVCGQAQNKPSFTDASFASYDMTQNRCCRETGKTITMYTETSSTKVSPSITDSFGLNANPFRTTASATDDVTPTTLGRYSRYSVVEHDNSASSYAPSIPGTTPTPVFNTPKVEYQTVGHDALITNSRYQWKTMNETAQRTCCGRGWVRKFADGTNDWTKRDRLSINPVDFACLNTKSNLPFVSDPESELDLSSGTYYSEYSRLCAAPADNNGCIQNPIIKSEAFEIIPPSIESGQVLVLSTLPDEDPTSSGTLIQINSLSVDTPYLPTPFSNSAGATDGPFNYLQSSTFGKQSISIVLPAYISAIVDSSNHIKSKGLMYFKTIKVTAGDERTFTLDHESVAYVDRGTGNTLELPVDANLECSSNAPGFWPPVSSWCLQFLNNKVIVKISNTREATANDSASVTALDPSDDFDYGVIEIGFVRQSLINQTAGSNLPTETTASEPGNDLYYLTKLAKLELLGIPQIYFEPVYCNSNREKLVPGIYKDDNATKSMVELNGTAEWFTYPTSPGSQRGYDHIYENGSIGSISAEFDPNNVSIPTSTGARSNISVTHAEGIARAPIWSDNEFMCCLNLGAETDDAGLCCSGFAVDGDTATDPDAKKTCKLPIGTNLHLYFNKFVSGDGMGIDQPAGGLTEDDFVPETGEIQMNNDALGKVRALGAEYCSSGEVRGGAAFGYFYAEPNTGNYYQNGDLEDSTMWSIADSNLDFDEANDTGFVRFLDGFRWNHHVYCK